MSDRLPDSPKSESSQNVGPYRFTDEDFDPPSAPARSDDIHPVAAATRAYLDRAIEDGKEEKRERAIEGPKYPFLVGIVEFPLYLNTLLCWIPLSLLLLGTSLVLVFSMSLRGTAIALAFTLGYAAACGTKIVEATANGLDVVEWPSWGEWKEWMWAYVQLLCYLTCSLLVAAALTWWSRSLYWIPTAVVMFIVFPYVVLSAMEADSWLPLSTDVPRTLKSHAWAWGIFYGEAVLLIAAWSVLTVVVSVGAGSVALVVTSPLLAALVIIYARLLGRLAWVISR